MTKVTRVKMLQLRGLRHLRTSSRTTGKPNPPTMTARLMVSNTQGSPMKPSKFREYGAKPALLKPEIARKTPSYTAEGTLSALKVTSLHATTNATNTWTTRAKITILLRMPLRSSKETDFVSTATACRARSPKRRKNTSANSVASVMMPSPPIWMRIKITT